MRSDARLLAAAAIAAMILGAGGCATRAVSDSSLVDDPTVAGDQLEYFDGLERRQAVSNNDALHGLFLVADGADGNADYESRVAEAKARRWLPEKWEAPANEDARLGDIAVAVCRITDIQGGLTMRIIGPTPVYATRELMYEGLLPQRAANQSIRGLEFLDLLGRVDDRLAFGDVEPTTEERVRDLEGPVEPAAAPEVEAATQGR